MKRFFWQRSAGFTLLELLVAMAVMLIVGLLIAQIVGAVTRAARLSNQGADATAQARLTLDRIGQDLGSTVFRPDVDFMVSPTNSPNANFLDLLSTLVSPDPVSASASFTNRRISRVAYRIAPSADFNNLSCLQRAGQAIGWNQSGFMGIMTNGMTTNGVVTNSFPVSFTNASFPVSLAASDFDVLSPAVIQVVVGFQLYPDDSAVMLADGTLIPNARGQIVYSPPMRDTAAPGNAYVDPSRISSLVVGVVSIDPEKLKTLTPSILNTLASAFTGVPAQGQLPVAKWMADTGNLAGLPNSVPLPVRQSVRVYQRFFPITPYGTRSP